MFVNGNSLFIIVVDNVVESFIEGEDDEEEEEEEDEGELEKMEKCCNGI